MNSSCKQCGGEVAPPHPRWASRGKQFCSSVCSRAHWRQNNKAKKAELQREYRLTPKGKYTVQKDNAKKRGVPWEFTFDEWWEVWEPYWDDRGRGAEALCMARFGDTGPYRADNVEIITNKQNGLDICKEEFL